MKIKEIKINDLIVSDKYIIYDYDEKEEINLYIKSKTEISQSYLGNVI